MGKILTAQSGIDVVEKYKQKYNLRTHKELSEHLNLPYQTVAGWYRRHRVPTSMQNELAAKIDSAWTISFDQIKKDKLQTTSEGIKSLTSMYSMVHIEFFSCKLLISEMIFNLAIDISKHYKFGYRNEPLKNFFSDRIEDTKWLQTLMFDVIFENKNDNILHFLSNPKIAEMIKLHINSDNDMDATMAFVFLSNYFGKENNQKIIQNVLSLLIPKGPFVRFYEKEFVPGQIKEYITSLSLDVRKTPDPLKESLIDHEIEYLRNKHGKHYNKPMFSGSQIDFDIFL
jgi:hypothetical protein